MASTAIRGIVAFCAAVVVVIGTLWIVPDVARAADPLPPPVDELPDIPSRVVKSVTGSPIGDSAVNMLRAMSRMNLAGTPVPEVVRPITPATAITRGAGGSMVLPFYAGFAVGKGGLAIYAAATGTTYEQLECSTPDWYQGATAFLQLGMFPDCKGRYSSYGPEVRSGGQLAYGGYSWNFSNSQDGTSNGNLSRMWCGPATGTIPSGYSQRRKSPNPTGWVYYSSFDSGGQSGGCWNPGSPYVTLKYPNTVSGTRTGYPVYEIVQSSTGTVVATSTPIVVEAGQDALRTARCTVTWEDGMQTTGAGMTYREGEGLPLSVEGTGCKTAWDAKPGAGRTVMPDRIRLDSEDGTGAITQLADQDVPPFTSTDKLALDPTLGNGRGLVLEKTVGTVVKSCMTWEADCSNWWTATSSGTVPTTGTVTYRCTYAGQTIPLVECGPYRNTFDTQTSTPTITDPTTGTTQPWTSSGSAPSTGGSTFPQTGTSPGVVTSTATGGGGCTAGWSWNPVDWVLNPLRCAFIPSAAVLTATTTSISTAWDETWPSQGMATIAGVLADVPSASGCSGPRVQFDLTWPAPVHFDAEPLNACNEPVSTLAWFARVIGALSIMFATAWGVSRRLASIVNARGMGPGA